MSNITISDAIRYIGCDDKDIDLFESQYIVPNGISYNSYVILDEQITVMDTVDERKTDEWFANLEAALDGKTPAYLVISHLEPDHAANIKKFADKYPETKLVVNPKSLNMIPQFFEIDNLADRAVVVKEGEELCIGAHTLQFFMAPMVHWPEVMVTYEQAEKVLFSADGFGKFGALDADEDWACEARRYYMNIVGKYGAQVQALLKKAATLDIQTICPLHGPILTENLGYYINLYDIWSSYKPENDGIVVCYASAHGNTAKAAQQLAEILKAKGAPKVKVFDLARSDMAEVIEDLYRYEKAVLCSITYDGGMFPVMADLLYHLKIKLFQNKKIGLMQNGSWGPIAGKLMRDELEKMKNITIVEPVVTIKSTVKPETVKAMEELADAMLNA